MFDIAFTAFTYACFYHGFYRSHVERLRTHIYQYLNELDTIFWVSMGFKHPRHLLCHPYCTKDTIYSSAFTILRLLKPHRTRRYYYIQLPNCFNFMPHAIIISLAAGT